MSAYALPALHLHNTRLRTTQVVYLALMALALGLFVAALPARYAELRSVSDAGVYQQLAPVEAELLQGIGLSPDTYAAYLLVVEGGLVAAFAALTAVLVWRKPDDGMALFVALSSVAYGVYITSPLDTLASAAPLWRQLSTCVQALGLWCAVVFCYLFPDGRFTLPRTRLMAVACAAWVLLLVLVPSTPFNPANPFALSPAAFVVHLGWFLTGLLAQAHRYRREVHPARREQTKWVTVTVAGGIALYAAFVAARLFWPALDQPGPARLVYHLAARPLYLVCLFLIPLSVLLSIVRYRLWDIELFLNRALVSTTLTTLLAAIYLSSVVALQWAFFGTGALAEALHSPVVVAVSTLALTALFSPLRRRVQAGIDRRFFRHKYDAARTLAAVGLALRDEVNLTHLVEQLQRTVEETLRPAHVFTWLSHAPCGFSVSLSDPHESRMPLEVRADDPLIGILRAAADPVDLARLKDESRALDELRAAHVALLAPLVTRGELVGWLSLGPRLSESDFSAEDRALLAQLTTQVAPAIRVAQLARHNQAEAIERERRDQEMRLARLIQQRLLPQSFPPAARLPRRL